MIILLLIIVAVIAFAFSFGNNQTNYEQPTYNPKGGYVYCVRNKLFKEYVKIGLTTRTVEERIKEFNTAAPFNYEAQISISTNDVFALESLIHSELKDYHVNREWFKISEDKLSEILNDLNA